jgi:hypothetical protein
MCPPFLTLNHEIHQGRHATEGDLVTVIFNLVASNILKWQTFKLLSWMKHLHQSTLDYQG